MDNKLIGFMAIATAVMLFVGPSTVFGKGLTLNVYVHGPAEIVGKQAQVTANTDDDFTKTKSVTVPDRNFYVTFQYDDGQVPVGSTVAACAHVDHTGLNGCERTTNGPEKAPERLDIYLTHDDSWDNGDSSQAQAQSQTQSQEQSQSQSQSQSQQICIFGC